VKRLTSRSPREEARTVRDLWLAYAPNVGRDRGLTMLAAFPMNWLETTILLVAWVALFVDVLRQQWISRGAKIAWMVFIILVPVVSWIAYGVVRHRHGVGPGR
jgi:hypothetical protein